jgi:hypothetical protein
MMKMAGKTEHFNHNAKVYSRKLVKSPCCLLCKQNLNLFYIPSVCFNKDNHLQHNKHKKH